MRLAPLILAALTLGPSANRALRTDRRDRRLSRIVAPYASSDGAAPIINFGFGLPDGGGLGAACACTTPSGTAGEVMTFTRASTAYCIKASETTPIAVGDLVECTANQPRVMPGVDGTGGVGLAVWEARTNSLIRSQELDDVAWGHVNGGDGLDPVVTANAALAPDNTMTAERVQFSATTANGYSLLYQNNCPATTQMLSLYIKGNGASGTFGLDIAGGCVVVNYTNGVWSRVSYSSVTGSFAYIGTNSADCAGHPAFAAADVFLWQVDCQAGVAVGPPIKTAGTAATRAAEVAYLTLPASPLVTGVYSAALTLGTGHAAADSWTAYDLGTLVGGEPTDQGSITLGNYSGDVLMECFEYPASVLEFGVSASRAQAGAFNASRIACYNDGTQQGVYNGVAFATPEVGLRTAPDATRLYLGSGLQGGDQVNGVVKQLCISSDSSVCR